MTNNEAELREAARKILRSYYNATFEYCMEQLKKGDITAIIANAESKQQELDDPYLDQIMQLISDHTRKAIEAELEQLLCPIGCHYGDNCKVEHTRLRKSYIKDRLAALKQPTVEEE